MKSPADCQSMPELRAEIDALDAELVALLARRTAYIDRAAEIKQGEGLPARIASRVEEVVARVRGHATAKGLDPDLVDALWRRLIDWSIEREEKALNGDGSR